MTQTLPKIGVMICSTREPRACPQIARFVIDTIKTTTTKENGNSKPLLKVVDLKDWKLPMYDESGVPAHINDPAQYDHTHTREWSREISSYDAFIFVTPQYNWGYPAALKNAIDFLYIEWRDKPAMIVTYGGHGGNKCGSQLREVLMGVKMVTTSKNVELAFPDKEATMNAARGNDLNLDGTTSGGLWGGAERKHIAEVFKDLTGLLSANTCRD